MDPMMIYAIAAFAIVSAAIHVIVFLRLNAIEDEQQNISKDFDSLEDEIIRTDRRIDVMQVEMDDLQELFEGHEHDDVDVDDEVQS